MQEKPTIIFDSKPNPERHPDRLRVVAALRGMEAAPFSNCSVLDIGCGVGVDLIHFAQCAPESTFAGFDISEEHLQIGRNLIGRLALENVSLENTDIAAFSTEKKFDYILCHGVYSWVNASLRERILTICKNSLSSNGVACITFNCLPGWQARSTIRTLLLQTDNQNDTPEDRVTRARKTMEAALERIEEGSTHHSEQIKHELQSCLLQSGAFIFHELLGETNEAFFLTDFMRSAEKAGLQYLGDGRPSKMHVLPGELEDREFRKALSLQNADEVKVEQIWDTIVAPPIRTCLLCMPEQTIVPQPEFSHIYNMHASSSLVPLAEEPKTNDTSIEIFCDPREYNLEVKAPGLKAALTILSRRWPKPILVSSLSEEITKLTGELNQFTDISAKPLLSQLGEYFFMNLIDLYCEAPILASSISDKPLVFPLAREQAALGFSWISNPRFEYIQITDVDRLILSLLDGEHSQDQLVSEIQKMISDGRLEYEPLESSEADRDQEKVVTDKLSEVLKHYYESALLIA